ncbi:oxidoreductase [Dyella amyloliquefaciens]|uniref:oxidoreductase n=1 Tax=Dyella amyloliquefaciens TaxID=1770545 RepID=UPI00102E3026|nr:oxidoreductase [Dyella amyloliquefaciens]
MSQVWLITGSSRGFGKALAEAVLAAGHRLVATARQPAQLESLVKHYGDQVRTVALDVTDPATAHAAVQAAVEAFGRLDVVVNNAGYGNLATIEEGSDEDFRAQLETNFFGTVNVTRAALPVLRRQRAGHIIQFSSIGGRIGVPGLAAYQSAKWAVEGFSEVLAKEVAAFGIKVTLVEPGGFRTDWGGPSMTVFVPAKDSEYTAVLAPMFAARQSYVGNESGDPAKAAHAILTIANDPQPPLRLLLGSDAVYLAEQQLAKIAAEDAKWRTLSLSTDFDLSPQAAEDRERMVRSVL